MTGSIQEQTHYCIERVREVIAEKLRKTFGDDVILIYAADVGSRSYGFACRKSDIDILFIFAQKDVFQYISTRYDVPVQSSIELNFHVLDESGLEIEVNCRGWDIIHFLRLLQKNNSAAIHCITSPNVSYEDSVFGRSFREKVLENMQVSLSFLGFFQSTLSVVKNNINRHLLPTKQVLSPTTNPKIYLYLIQYLLYAHELFEHGDRLRLWRERTSQSEKAKQNEGGQSTGTSQDEVTEHEESVTFSLPPLELRVLLQVTTLPISPRLSKYVQFLTSLKENNQSSTKRRLDFEVWILYHYRRMYTSRWKVDKEYDDSVYEGFLRNFLRELSAR